MNLSIGVLECWRNGVLIRSFVFMGHSSVLKLCRNNSIRKDLPKL
jgi:hypothetical protein